MAEEQAKSNELKEFIHETLRQIDEGIEPHNLYGKSIEFDIAIMKSTEKGGKVGVEVLGQGVKGGLSQTDERTSRIKFKVFMKREREDREAEQQAASMRNSEPEW